MADNKELDAKCPRCKHLQHPDGIACCQPMGYKQTPCLCVTAPPTPAVNYLQAIRGTCFAHGPYEGGLCPKHPACATDPQIYKPDAATPADKDAREPEFAFIAEFNPVPVRGDKHEAWWVFDTTKGRMTLAKLLEAYASPFKTRVEELELFNQSLANLCRRVWEAIEPTGEYEGDENLVQFAKSMRVAKESAEWSRDGLLFRAEAAESRLASLTSPEKAREIADEVVQTLMPSMDGEMFIRHTGKVVAIIQQRLGGKS